MAKSKKSYVYFGVNLPAKLARKFEFHLAAARAAQPFQTITKSGFFSHVIGEWISILESPDYDPSIVVPVRRRVRPPATRTKGCLKPHEVRAIRKDKRPSADVARELGVNRSTVGRIRNGTTHRAVT